MRALIFLYAFLAGAISNAAFAAEPRTAAAVVAADDAWGSAEVMGDAAFVDALLMPEYRSVGADGHVTDKATIVAHTRSHAKSPEFAAKVVAWKDAHPERADVTLFGDTAIVRWISTKPGGGDPVASCDVFVYRGGRWRAIYSQHTSVFG
ncbi:MAG: nuclear transport factor 2 family protein [Sphingomonadaceae bacterium]|nr:nuclear transport factor 2 family protein [Sphingomonadaceae bacterium]